MSSTPASTPGGAQGRERRRNSLLSLLWMRSSLALITSMMISRSNLVATREANRGGEDPRLHRKILVGEWSSSFDSLMKHRSRFLTEHADPYSLTNITPALIRDSTQHREVIFSIDEEVNFTSHPMRLANYLKPMISAEDHKRMDEAPTECLANDSAHAAARHVNCPKSPKIAEGKGVEAEV
ncbi:hypothetical protein HAX54_008090 [Datura stramonium]|uniref:Uncharacterized protein n=1 Tax=Datura stramonium TaxID=4076 RepID=A0ABS8TCQ8_DATST|nr:hypothetical protein [Datura stramonium]